MIEEQEINEIFRMLEQIQTPLLKLIKMVKHLDYDRRYKH